MMGALLDNHHPEQVAEMTRLLAQELQKMQGQRGRAQRAAQRSSLEDSSWQYVSHLL
jgi:hypothetical protein